VAERSPWIAGIIPWATETGYRRKAEFCPSTDIGVAWEVVDRLQGSRCFDLRRRFGRLSVLVWWKKDPGRLHPLWLFVEPRCERCSWLRSRLASRSFPGSTQRIRDWRTLC